MKRDMDNLDLRDAFPEMPEACRDALLQTARSVKEEEPVKRTAIRTILIAAAIIIATTAVAFAAGNLIFGWVDFFENDNIKVPQSAQLIMAESGGETIKLGPVTFTVKEKYCDPYTALASTVVSLNDGEKGILTGDDPFYFIGAYGEIGRAVAKRLGVDPKSTWAEAAKQLNLPLYSVRATLEVPEELSIGEWMEDPLFNEDGSLTYFCMPLLNGKATGENVDCQLVLMVQEINVDDPENQPEAIWEYEKISIQLQMPSEIHTYNLTEEYTAYGLTLTGVRAEQTPAGLYLFTDYEAQEGMTLEDFNGQEQLRPCLYSTDGERYGLGLNLSTYIITDEWPHVTIMRMCSLDSIPDTMFLALGDQSDDDASALRITLTK